MMSDHELIDNPNVEVDLDEVISSDEVSPRDAIAAKYAESQREESAPIAADLPEMVEVKVNGKVKTVSREKVEQAGGVDVYQKRLAAEEGMQQLSQERQAIKAEQQRIRDEAQRFEAWKASELAKMQKPASSPAELKELAKQYREAIYDGDDDKADEALIQIAAMRSSQQIDINRIKHEAAAAAHNQYRHEVYTNELTTAQREFATKYQDVVDDPNLFALADAKTVEIMREHPDWTPSRVIDAAGEAVRAWARGVTAPATTSKQDAKRALSSPRSATGRYQQTAKKPMTNSDYVKQLIEQRGGGV